MKLRDRDAIVTKEGLIFRVLGYDHPPDAYFCDLEYAPTSVFKSVDPKAARGHGKTTHYKLYEDEAWTYLRNRYPQYLIPHEMLQKKVIGVCQPDIAEVRRPQEELKELLAEPDKDELISATQNVLDLVTEHSGLTVRDFGVFGSMLHNFHHPGLSDIDLTVYGRKESAKLREILGKLYSDPSSPLRNEFETDRAIRGKRWRFRNLSLEEYARHQRRKLVYALLRRGESGRAVKVEFEPVQEWTSISNDYDEESRIVQEGWTKMEARVVNDACASFIPSVYDVRPSEMQIETEESFEACRIVSYLEEFRLQASTGDHVVVEGNLESVIASGVSSTQVTLTCCPRYYEQVLKCIRDIGYS